MRAVDFNELPRATRERFIAALRAPGYAFGGNGPVFAQASTTGAVVGWVLLLLCAGGAFLAVTKSHYGSPWEPQQSAGYLVAYVGLLFLCVLAIVGLVRRTLLSKALPFAPGVYLFPVDLVVARSKDLVLYPLASLLRLQPTHHYRNGFYSYTSFDLAFEGGASFTFTVGGREIAERQLDALRYAQRQISEALERGDMNVLAALDPFMEARIQDFRPTAEPGPVAGGLPAWTRLGWAIALGAGVVIGAPTWLVRNLLSDEAAFKDLRRYESTYSLEAYANAGGRHADEVRKNLIPRAYLKKAKEEPKEKRVEAIEKFLKDYPNSTVEADARTALADALHGEFLSRTTVTGLREFLKKWPTAADAPAARTKIHALYQKSLADFRAHANPNDKNVVPVVEALVTWMESHESPPLEVKFRRKNAASLAAADKLLSKGMLDDDGPARGGNAQVSSHFTATQAVTRETAVVRALEKGFRQVFPADILPLKRGADDEQGDGTAPAITVDYEVGWSGTTYIGRDSGRRFVGIMVRFDVGVKVPNEPRALSFAMKVEPPESFTVDYTKWDSSFRSAMGKSYGTSPTGGPSDSQVYDVMALRAFDQLSTKMKNAFFDAETASTKGYGAVPKKPALKRAADDEDDDGDDL